MLSIEGVLERLAGSRSPDEVAETIRRLLPLPTLWTALREPGVAERCLAADGGGLSPGGVLPARPGAWREALACAWPHLGQAQVWIRALESRGDVGLQLAGIALTSNSTAMDAA